MPVSYMSEISLSVKNEQRYARMITGVVKGRMKIKKIVLPLEKAHRILSPRIPYLVTTVDRRGRVNAAPFSNCTSVSTNPERLVLAVYRPWDTFANIRATRAFVVNVPSRHLLREVWMCGDKYAGHPIPRGVNELRIAGLTEIPSEKVRPPRIAECHTHLECRVRWMKDVGNHVLILADIVAASYTKGSFTSDLRQNVRVTQPLFEIGSGFFTSPSRVQRVSREKIKQEVTSALKKLKVRIPKSLKIYEHRRFPKKK